MSYSNAKRMESGQCRNGRGAREECCGAHKTGYTGPAAVPAAPGGAKTGLVVIKTDKGLVSRRLRLASEIAVLVLGAAALAIAMASATASTPALFSGLL